MIVKRDKKIKNISTIVVVSACYTRNKHIAIWLVSTSMTVVGWAGLHLIACPRLGSPLFIGYINILYLWKYLL